MQDRYAGDIGDFGKLGLLRHLGGGSDHADPLTLGVLWWRVPDEAGTNDGQHVAYLEADDPRSRQLRAYDEDLASKLRTVVARERSVASLQAVAPLPSSTRYHADPLAFDGNTSKEQRLAHRRAWLQKGLDAIAGADVAFLDPDNGLEVRSTTSDAKKGPKYVFYEEARAVYERGHSLVVYHHIGRTGTMAEQVRHRQEALERELGLDVPPPALLFRRVSPRAYFVVARPEHRARIDARVEAFMSGPWGEPFDFVEGATPSVGDGAPRFREYGVPVQADWPEHAGEIDLAPDVWMRLDREGAAGGAGAAWAIARVFGAYAMWRRGRPERPVLVVSREEDRRVRAWIDPEGAGERSPAAWLDVFAAAASAGEVGR